MTAFAAPIFAFWFRAHWQALFSFAATLMSILLIFVDGVGIGTRGSHNPLDAGSSEFFSIFQRPGQTDGLIEERDLPFDGRLAVTDARLGVAGLPQSATGQTTMLTGVNASALIGKHLHGYPSPALKEALAEHSIYRKLQRLGLRQTFANAYAPQFFESRPRWVSATTVAAEAAGLPLRTMDDLRRGAAVYHDFTNRLTRERGGEVETISAEAAGGNLARLAAAHDFTLYEHFLTDRIGHEQDYELACEHLRLLTRFVRAVLESVDLQRQTVLITSDHGNLEDLTTRSHTMNPVATLAFGKERERLAARVRALTDITPAIVEALS